MANQYDVKQKKREGRSPGYPAIDLETAIKRAEEIKKEEQRHLARLDAVVKHWGYSSKSGPFLGTLSALIKFGLLETDGKGDDRKVKITDLAWTILIDDREDSPERDKAIKEAALNPAIHRKLWDRYGGNFPSSETFRIVLLKEYKFMERAVKDFIGEFERTITFAKLEEFDTLSGHEEDKTPHEKEISVSPQPITTPKVGSQPQVPLDMTPEPTGEFSFPLSPKRWVHVRLPYRLTEKEWARILKRLEMFKDGFMDPSEFEGKEGKKGEED